VNPQSISCALRMEGQQRSPGSVVSPGLPPVDGTYLQWKGLTPLFGNAFRSSLCRLSSSLTVSDTG
jgi:hypothetical protein